MIHSVQCALSVVQGAPKTVAAATRSPKIMGGLYHTKAPPQHGCGCNDQPLVSRLDDRQFVSYCLSNSLTSPSPCGPMQSYLPGQTRDLDCELRSARPHKLVC